MLPPLMFWVVVPWLCHKVILLTVLHCLATELLKYFAGSSVILPYTDLPGMQASDCPQATIPPSLPITLYRPDLVIYNKENNSIFMLELTCPLDSTCHLEIVSRVKQNIWRLCLSSSVSELPVLMTF